MKDFGLYLFLIICMLLYANSKHEFDRYFDCTKTEKKGD